MMINLLTDALISTNHPVKLFTSTPENIAFGQMANSIQSLPYFVQLLMTLEGFLKQLKGSMIYLA